MAKERMTKYKTHIEPFLDTVQSMRIDGYTERDIHNHLGVGHNAWNKYKKEHPELQDVLRVSKKELVSKLEDVLYNKALKGDNTCLIFSLKSLHPKKYVELTKVESVNVNKNVDFSKLSKKEIKELLTNED